MAGQDPTELDELVFRGAVLVLHEATRIVLFPNPLTDRHPYADPGGT